MWLLQARPMTALPDPVDWTPPTPGYWMRNLRLGEWLPEPMTPLFADWLLDRLDHGEQQATREDVGAALPFPYAAINGWYYLATPPLSPRTLLPRCCRAVAGCCGSSVTRCWALAVTRWSPTGACWPAWPRSGAPSCCPATGGWSRRATSRS